MNHIRCLIVEDEPLAREILKTHLGKLPGWELVGSCMNAEEAYAALLKSAVDVMFLDVQMPVISGIEFLKSLRKPPLVVFTTAYSQYAVAGFELNAVDYLMKPITLDRFLQATEKVKEKLVAGIRLPATGDTVAEVPYFFIKDNGRFLKINFQDILYIKAEKDFSDIYTKERKFLASMHLKLLEEALPEKLFTRVHRSYIVQHTKVSSIYGNTLRIEQQEIPIGASFKDDLFRKLNIS